MGAEDISVGMRVRIREFDDMLDEFGGEGGNINTPILFAKDMRYLCGQEFIVDEVRIAGNDSEVFFEEHEILRHSYDNGFWHISPAMLEPAEPMPEIYTEGDLYEVLGF